MISIMWNNANLIKVLQNGGVAIIPTDTIYGIVGKALNQDTVERIYDLKKRAPEKPCINLIGDLNELEKFNLTISLEQKKQIENFKEPTSFIIDSLSFRLPQNKELQDLLLKTGPLIAPSANPEGLPPAENIFQAKTYFSDSVNVYIDGREIKGKPSRLVKLHKDGTIDVLRN